MTKNMLEVMCVPEFSVFDGFNFVCLQYTVTPLLNKKIYIYSALNVYLKTFALLNHYKNILNLQTLLNITLLNNTKQKINITEKCLYVRMTVTRRAVTDFFIKSISQFPHKTSQNVPETPDAFLKRVLSRQILTLCSSLLFTSHYSNFLGTNVACFSF